MKRTILALSLFVGLVGSAAATTTFDYDHTGPSTGPGLVLSGSTINGVFLGSADAALWATDGVPFDLARATFKIDYPINWDGGVPPLDDPATDWDESQTYYRISGFKDGVEVARSESFGAWDATGTHFTMHNTVGWGEVATRELNWTNLDLVTWHSGAHSDGTALKVLSVSGAGITAAVPEPETYAMMLAGLGITAVAARRRRQRG